MVAEDRVGEEVFPGELPGLEGDGEGFVVVLPGPLDLVGEVGQVGPHGDVVLPGPEGGVEVLVVGRVRLEDDPTAC